MLVAIFLLMYLRKISSLIIYNSSIPTENGDALIGMKYLKVYNQVLDTEIGFSTCIRFNFRKFDSYLFYFGQAKYSTLGFEIQWTAFEDGLMRIGTVTYYNGNEKVFGYPWFRNINEEKALLSVNKWNHLCISFGQRYSNLTIILV